MKFCTKPYEQVYVFPNGDVRVCGWSYQNLGNILEDELEDIWHGETAETLRDTFRNGSFSCCNKVACPYCNTDSLEELTEEEVLERSNAMPLPLDYNVTDYICNHSCPSCRNEVYRPSEEYTSNMRKIIQKLVPYLNQARLLDTDGQGDCFASPHIMEMLESIRPERKDFRLVLETNGTLCDKKHLDRISHLFEKEVHISVTPNSFDRRTFKYLSGGHDNLDQVVSNLYYIRELREQEKINQFDISIVVQDTNYKELPSFVERCLEDFRCDKVIRKPVYHWFSLTLEEYWFKNILNPKHPYFNDYMEILKDPILNDPRIFFWGGHDVMKEKEHPAYQYKHYFDTFMDIMKREHPEKDLEKALLDRGCGRVAIYSVNDMAALMFRLLKDTKIDVAGFVDRDATVDTFCGMPVTKFDTYRPEMADTILVSNFYWLFNVTKDLRFRGFEGEIIPFDKIL